MPAEQIENIFSALSDPSRQRVVEILKEAPCCAGDLARRLEITPQALSRHLRILRRSGLIREEHNGDDARYRIYQLRREPILALKAWVTEVEAFWTQQLASFKDQVDREIADSGGKVVLPRPARNRRSEPEKPGRR